MKKPSPSGNDSGEKVSAEELEEFKRKGIEHMERELAYAKENLEDDIYIAFLQSLTKSCIATGGDWIDKYLKKYGEDSKMVVKILTRKDGK